MFKVKSNDQLSKSGKSVLHTLLYFDVFSYPLTLDEIHQCNNQPDISKEQIRTNLEYMVAEKLVYRFEDIYTLHADENIIERRKNGNRRAELAMKKAHDMSRLIARFPFVRGVCLSGSISKNYMDKETDIDYFIITSPERLWIARMSLILFKKIFLLNSHKYFCLNYFVTADHLEIEEKNIFTATELVTLKPTFGSEVFDLFYRSNSWTKQYYPNYKKKELMQVNDSNGWLHKKVLEKLLNNSFGAWLDNRFMKLTMKVWKAKFKDFNEADFEIALKSKPYVSKHHPNYFQKKVLNTYEEKIKTFEKTHGISLNGHE